MRTICRTDGMPVMTTIFRWLRENPEFKQRYDIAKAFQADALAEDMLEIADSEASITSDGKVDSGHVQHRRLQIDTRKWVASKLLPKKYGDKLEQEVKGDVGLVVQIVRMGDDGEIND